MILGGGFRGGFGSRFVGDFGGALLVGGGFGRRYGGVVLVDDFGKAVLVGDYRRRF